MPSTTQRVIADRYTLLSSLGRGAMGEVWLADDGVLRRRVAVKEIDIPEGFQAEERSTIEARVLREARVAARLAHPAAVSVFDVISHDSKPWIVMELVEAPTLEEVVKSEGPMEPAKVADIGAQLLDVLDAAHSQGVVHRDVKPANVMCTGDGRVKLADFGIATLQDDPKLTASGLVLGSPSFMSPEHASTGVSGPESDLWSLGATLYFAVEGEPPFDKGAAVPTLTAVMGEEPRPMKRAGALAPIISAMLTKEPSERPSLSEACDALSNLDVHQATTVAAPAGLPATAALTAPDGITTADRAPTPTAAPARASEERSVLPARRTNPWPWVVAAAVLLLGAIFLIPRLGDEATPTQERAGGRQAAGGGQARGDGASTETETDTDSEADSDAVAELPGDWEVYKDPTTGFQIATPPGWEQVPDSLDDGSSVDLRDPSSSSYLRVDWVSPPGDDVLGTLQGQAEGFGEDHANYVNLGVSPAEFNGYEAALWEYTYTDGIDLHAYNLQFVIEDDYGFALNFQTSEEDWPASTEIWDTIRRTFVPPR